MKILWIVPKWTLPTIDGATVATDKLIRNLAGEDLEVDLACVSQECDELSLKMMQKNWPIKQVFHAQRTMPNNKLVKALFYGSSLIKRPGTPLTMSSFQNRKLRKSMEALLRAGSYDWAVLDGLHLGAIFVKGEKFIRPYGTKFLYRAHNVESDLWFDAAKKHSNPIFKKILSAQGKLIKKYEKIIVENVDLIAPISKEDDVALVNRYKGIKTCLSPLGLEFSNTLGDILNKRQKSELLFLGKLDWEPNKKGLEWFLNFVWPYVDHEKLSLTIAGSGDGRWLEGQLPIRGVKYIGFAEDKEELFKQCDLALAPIFFGSGTRIKVVEPYSFGRSVITSKEGAKGSSLVQGEDYILAQEPQEWISVLNNLDNYDLKQMAISGADRLRESLDEKAIALGLIAEMRAVQT